MPAKKRTTPLRQQVRVQIALKKKRLETLQKEIVKLERILAAMTEGEAT